MEVSWVDALPQMGVGGVLVAIIVYVLRSNHQDRQQYSQLRAKADSLHDADIDELRAEVRSLREEIRTVRAELEEQRRMRWKAEDDAAYYRRLAGVSDDDGEPAPGAGVHPPGEPT